MKTAAIGSILALGLLSVPDAVAAQSPRTAEPTTTWLRKPGGEDMARYYPPEAQRRNLSGQAVIRCDLTADGRLKDCIILREIPAGLGFGAAALKVAPIFKMVEQDPHKTIRGQITIPIRWTIRQATVPVAPWRSVPTINDVVAAFPTNATAKLKRKNVHLTCQIQRSGLLDDCAPDEFDGEDSFPFEDAALGLTKKFRVEPSQAASLPVGTAVSFPIQIVSAEDPISSTRPLGEVSWLAVADASARRAAFPTAASKAGVSKGSAEISCTVAADGSLMACTPESETPANFGFGEAAVSVARRFRMNPWSGSGIPVEGALISLPIDLER